MTDLIDDLPAELPAEQQLLLLQQRFRSYVAEAEARWLDVEERIGEVEHTLVEYEQRIEVQERRIAVMEAQIAALRRGESIPVIMVAEDDSVSTVH
ncbi:MAG TPA: hypothetical protein VD995_32390 [Azospirillum sp.]|nr:hypothetical protein [Azospirillum sp.]